MPKKKRRKPRAAPRLHQAGGTSRPSSGQPEFVRDIRSTLASDHPHELLHLASSILSLAEPRPRTPFTDDQAPYDLDALLESFVGVPIPETTALLGALAALVDDDLLRQRLRREVAARDDAPDWVLRLDPLSVDRVIETSETLGDGSNVMVGVRTADGHPFTVVVFIDHNLGRTAKDGFVVHEPIADVLATFRKASGDDPDLHEADLDPADARARVAEAIEIGALTYPPFETDSWPQARPLVRWVLSALPPGGADYPWPEWSDEDRAELADRFCASEHGAGLNDEDRDLLDTLLWFGCDYGGGDPLRWSPVRVEVLLDDWLPRKIVADAGYLSRAPDLLRRFIRFAHAERGIRPGLTAETLAAVDEWEPDYQQAIRTPRLQGPMALLVAMGATPDYGTMILDELERAVGGTEALDTVNTEPLPDEPLDLHRVPGDVHDKVQAVAALADRCCEELLDTEHRTACRRLLADVAASDPGVFRRRGRDETAAAALVWMVVKANMGFRQSAGGLTAKAVGEWFGVGSTPGQRAPTLLKALGVEQRHDLALGSPRYLVTDRRRRILELRDRYRV